KGTRRLFTLVARPQTVPGTRPPEPTRNGLAPGRPRLLRLELVPAARERSERGDAQAPAQARRPAMPHVRAIAARAGHDCHARDGTIRSPTRKRGRGGERRRSVPGFAAQADRRTTVRSILPRRRETGRFDSGRRT